MYLIKNNKHYIVTNIQRILIYFVVLINLFITACQSAEYQSNLTDDSIANQKRVEVIPIQKSEELKWTWCIKTDKYNDLFFIDTNLIAAKANDDQYVILNTDGEVAIPFKYSNISSFEDGLALVENHEKYYFINRNGENAFDKEFEAAHSFRESLAAVKQNGSWGFIDITGKKIIKNQFEEVRSFQEGFAVVKKNGKWGVIDNKGDILINFQFDDMNDFSEGYAAVLREDKWGFINKFGKILVNFKFYNVKDYSEGYAAVSKDNKWGFIDDKGKIDIDLKYDDVGNFSEGKVSVKTSKNEENRDEWAYIDTNNNIVIDFYPYEGAGDQILYIGEFKEGLALVSKTLLSIIDSDGNNVYLGGSSEFFISSLYYSKEFDAIPAYIYMDENMKIKKYGLMGLNGNRRLEPIFDYIREIYGEYVVVENLINGEYKMGVIKIVTL